MVGRAVHDVRLLLVERLRIDDRIAGRRDDRARAAPRAAGTPSPEPGTLLLVERAQSSSIAAVAVALPRGDAREPLAEPARDLLVRPGPLVAGAWYIAQWVSSCVTSSSSFRSFAPKKPQVRGDWRSIVWKRAHARSQS